MGLSHIILMLHARTITGSLMSARRPSHLIGGSVTALENCLRDAPIASSQIYCISERQKSKEWFSMSHRVTRMLKKSKN